jgi:multiple antibiotic resistance protein
MKINLKEILSAFTVLFAIIDIIGSIPIIIDFQKKPGGVPALKISLISFALLIGFFFLGDGVLALFGVNISSFAVAGAIVIFAVAVEMTFDIEVFRHKGPPEVSSIVPLVFPLIVGAGSFTTILSLKAEFQTINIMIALFLNMVVVFVVLKGIKLIEKFIGNAGIYITRKFFGIILLAISVKLFTTNLGSLLSQFR